jgi:hypothetical protein
MSFSDAPKVERVEITQRDLLREPSWTSERLAVAGFFLGETRTQVLETVRHDGYNALCDDGAATRSSNACSITINKQSSYGGLSLDFGIDDAVNVIHIDWDYSLCEGNDCFAHRVKGPIGELLTKYSDHDRLLLLGPAIREKRLDARKGELVQYFYDERGMTLVVQRRATVAKMDNGNALVTLILEPVVRSTFPNDPSPHLGIPINRAHGDIQ